MSYATDGLILNYSNTMFLQTSNKTASAKINLMMRQSTAVTVCNSQVLVC